MTGPMEMPVLFLIFNRPENTAESFAAIAAAKPRRLFVVADGPRPERRGEAERCAAARNIVLSGVNWDCELKTCFREKNLGCGPGVSAGIDWFFSEVESGAVIEDDCVAGPDFFRFTSAMLDYYRTDDRVMHVSGDSFVDFPSADRASYRFSRYPMLWGWASWRRAWRHFDYNLGSYPGFRRNGELSAIFPDNPAVRRRWTAIFDRVRRQAPGFDTCWGFQWLYAIMRRRAFTVVPKFNLVTNIGVDAIHEMRDGALNLERCSLPNPVVHPPEPEFDDRFDMALFDLLYRNRPLSERLRKKLASWLAKIPVGRKNVDAQGVL
ncbi:MAG: hypothetical protein PHI85_01160 [Victivallaceae bacterium]|nr:hypothetical protein [Victivallaceae bacterium]